MWDRVKGMVWKAMNIRMVALERYEYSYTLPNLT